MNSNQIKFVVRIRGKKSKDHHLNNTLPFDNCSTKVLQTNQLYFIFTSNTPSDSLVISKNGLMGKTIAVNCNSGNDLEMLSNNLLNDAPLYHFDYVFNETISISQIFNLTIEDNLKKLFKGINSFTFIYGPRKSGKSLLNKGEANNKRRTNGLINYSMIYLKSLILMAKQSQSNSSYKIQLNIDIVYNQQCYHLLQNINQKIIIKTNDDLNKLLQFANHEIKSISQKIKDAKFITNHHFTISLSLIENEYKLASAIFIEVANDDNEPVHKYTEKKNNVYSDITNIIICLQTDILPVNGSSVLYRQLLKGKIKNDSLITLLCCISPFKSQIEDEFCALNWIHSLRNKISHLSRNVDKDKEHLNTNKSNNTSYIKCNINNPINQKITSYSFELVSNHPIIQMDLLKQSKIISSKYANKSKEHNEMIKTHQTEINSINNTIDNLKTEIANLKTKMTILNTENSFYEKQLMYYNTKEKAKKIIIIQPKQNNSNEKMNIIDKRNLMKTRLIRDFEKTINSLRKNRLNNPIQLVSRVSTHHF